METTLARASLYNFLAAAFGDPPTAELMAVVGEMLPHPEAGGDTWVRSLPDEMRRAYTRLLVGPGPGYVPPYASVHLRDERRAPPSTLHPPPSTILWGPEAVAVEAVYREAGLEIAPGQPRVPDHLALELQFMQHLCSREADALVRGQADEAAEWRARQRAFLQEHLWPWLPHYVAQVSQIETHPVYRALAEFTLAFVIADF